MDLKFNSIKEIFLVLGNTIDGYKDYQPQNMDVEDIKNRISVDLCCYILPQLAEINSPDDSSGENKSGVNGIKLKVYMLPIPAFKTGDIMKSDIQINRNDMLELTRRMTLKRNCFTRIAGAYFDEDGYVDGSFNIHFLKLSAKEKAVNLTIAKAILFSETNVNLKDFRFQKENQKQGSMWQMLMALKECELKNDALLDTFYEVIGEKYHSKEKYAAYLLHGNYDVPLKARDGESLRESEEVYSFIICAVCPFHGDYEPDMPQWGFLFPAFSDRSSDINGIAVYRADEKNPNIDLL